MHYPLRSNINRGSSKHTHLQKFLCISVNWRTSLGHSVAWFSGCYPNTSIWCYCRWQFCWSSQAVSSQCNGLHLYTRFSSVSPVRYKMLELRHVCLNWSFPSMASVAMFRWYEACTWGQCLKYGPWQLEYSYMQHTLHFFLMPRFLQCDIQSTPRQRGANWSAPAESGKLKLHMCRFINKTLASSEGKSHNK